MGVIIAAAGCAVNVGFYFHEANPVNLALAIFCGLMTLAFIVEEAL